MRALRLPAQPDLLARARELGALFDEVADVDWRHPAWWALGLGAALLERAASADDTAEMYTTYLAANGGPRADTFMARDRRSPPTVAKAVARARAAADALARLDGTLPGQPLRCTLAWRDGWLSRVPLAGPPRAAFITPRGTVVAATGAPDLEPVLAEYLAGQPLRPPLARVDPRQPTPAAIAVGLAEQPLATARHLHRAAWTPAGGPWLGLGDAAPPRLDIVTTCHLVVDGYGHGLISTEILNKLNDLPAEPPVHVPAAPPPRDAEPLGFAGAVMPSPRFPRAAWAMGRALARFFPQPPSSRRGPSFQIPVVPGPPSDPDRRRRRVLFALLALQHTESFDEFSARLSAIVARERAAAGVLSRLLGAISGAPLPDFLRRRLLHARGAPHPFIPPVAVLRGRGSLCTLRYPDDELPAHPLYAASSPGLSACAHDPHGAVVLTLVHHDQACTASLCGTGDAGTPAGAQRFLDLWREELEGGPRSGSARRGGGEGSQPPG